MIDKHDTYIGKLEAKQFGLSSNTLLDIIDVLDLTLNEFFAINLQNFDLINEINKNLSGLNKEELTVILENTKNFNYKRDI